LDGVEASFSAVVASRGRAERMTEEDRFGGMEEGDSSGIVSVIAPSCTLRLAEEAGKKMRDFDLDW